MDCIKYESFGFVLAMILIILERASLDLDQPVSGGEIPEDVLNN